ncbi:MAG: hypothetical protein D4Q79_01870 [Spirochaetia bacterium]|nr:MAG: hypothetical protein D4Q79_01870 [Spirochaetia bacterium]
MKKGATLKQAEKILSLFSDTPTDQLQDVIESGFLADVRDANNIADVNRDKLRQFFGLKPLGPSLLRFIGEVNIPATTEKFVARNKFVVDTGENAPVKISYLGDNFQEWFLGKIEESAAETTLRYAELVESSIDKPILSELGDTAETTLSAVYALMERQQNREDGALLTNGYANIFYVRDVNGELRAVRVYWRGGGWGVRAGSVGRPTTWDDGYRVFSCNS